MKHGYKTWIWCHPSPLLPIFSSGHSQYCNKKSPCGPKSIFPRDPDCKRSYKTVDRTPSAINMVSYYSLYCIFLSHISLIVVKLFEEKSFFVLNDVTAVRAARLSQRHDGITTTPKVNLETRNFLAVYARRATLTGLYRCHLLIIYTLSNLRKLRK